MRHSVFIVGNAGTGKTMVWRTLFKTYQNQKRKPVYYDLNPKAVTNNELFGIINPATREWKDGRYLFMSYLTVLVIAVININIMKIVFKINEQYLFLLLAIICLGNFNGQPFCLC